MAINQRYTLLPQQQTAEQQITVTVNNRQYEFGKMVQCLDMCNTLHAKLTETGFVLENDPQQITEFVVSLIEGRDAHGTK